MISAIQARVSKALEESGQRPNRLRLGRETNLLLCRELSKLHGTKIIRLRTFYGMRVSVDRKINPNHLTVTWEEP